MCGVLYFKGDSKRYGDLLIALLEQSRIRGLHAFGVSIREAGQPFQTMRSFTLEEAKEFIRENTFYELIGHTRYDTSGDWRILENNQPIVVGQCLLAFNGVVRMCSKEQYEEEFQREYTTANDGEIPLRMFAEGEQDAAMTLLKEERVSFAGIVHWNGKTIAVRNERRPLWEARVQQDARFVFSTLDIWQRAVRSLGKSIKVKARELSPMEVLWL